MKQLLNDFEEYLEIMEFYADDKKFAFVSQKMLEIQNARAKEIVRKYFPNKELNNLFPE